MNRFFIGLNTRTAFIFFVATAALSGCGGSDHHQTMSASSSSMMTSPNPMPSSSMPSSTGTSSSAVSEVTLTYVIKVQNLTAAQPFSPVAVILHQHGYKAYVTGAEASVAVEKIAEGGDATQLLTEANANALVLKDGRMPSGIAPGKNDSLTLSVKVNSDDVSDLEVSLLAMLGATNDGFVAMSAYKIGSLAQGESMTVDAVSYDAGTEANTETAETVPHTKGQGFNAARDDIVNVITLHPGLVSKDDGLASSALTSVYRWDNPVARITLTRQ